MSCNYFQRLLCHHPVRFTFAQAALAADETTAATGGAKDVMKLEVRDEGAELAEVAAVDEAAAAVHTPARQVFLFLHAGSTRLAGFRL